MMCSEILVRAAHCRCVVQAESSGCHMEGIVPNAFSKESVTGRF